MSEIYYIWSEGQFLNKARSWEFVFGSNKEIDKIILQSAYLFDSIESATSFASELDIQRCVFLSIEQEKE